MKQSIKRLFLMICMAACIFSLTACAGRSEAEAETLDQETASYICQVTENLLQQMTSFSQEEAEEAEAELLKNDQDVLASGLTSWVGVMKDTGAFSSILSSDAELSDDDGYVCTVQAQFEYRRLEFKVIYTMNQQTLEPTSVSFSPEYTTGEKMTKAAMNTLMGMGTVFAVLIFISLLIGCFKYINVFENKAKAKAAAAAPAPAVSAPVQAAAPVEEEELADDLELVAVITAAIAAATGSSTDGLVVRSIKRAPGAKWKRA